MLDCFLIGKKTKAVPITCIQTNVYSTWLNKQSKEVQHFLKLQFDPQVSNSALIQDRKGNLSQVIVIISISPELWDVADLAYRLPEGYYYFDIDAAHLYQQFAIGWGIGAYRFTKYLKSTRSVAKLVLKNNPDEIQNVVEAIHWVRDLINTPTEDMGPSELSNVAKKLAKTYNAKFKVIVGDALLQQSFGLIHAVGRASDEAPRLVDMQWGKHRHPKITLVGKGVCFDTGGLDIKHAGYMLLMKKDMGGAAHALGLAKMIMAAKLKVHLRVLLPIAENAVGGNAYRPGDVFQSHQGLTVEVGNTDAEGRLVVADALSVAVEDKPELLIDLTTLTGSARIALGAELPAVFTNNDKLLTELLSAAKQENDPMWQMPLFAPYRIYLNSIIADLNNNPSDGLGGAITAALFLKEFVPDDIPWLHFDMMAWNTRHRPGRPIGGEAMTIRALFAWIKAKFN